MTLISYNKEANDEAEQLLPDTMKDESQQNWKDYHEKHYSKYPQQETRINIFKLIGHKKEEEEETHNKTALLGEFAVTLNFDQ